MHSKNIGLRANGLVSKVNHMHIGVIVFLIHKRSFFLWQLSRGEQVGKRIGFLLNIWGAVILFYLVMIVFFKKLKGSNNDCTAL